MILSWETPNIKTAYSYSTGLNRLTTGLTYMLFGQGFGRQNFLEAGAFLKSRPDLDRPDLQLHCVLAIMKDHGKQSGAEGRLLGARLPAAAREPRPRRPALAPTRSPIRPSSPTIWRPRKTAARCARAPR